MPHSQARFIKFSFSTRTLIVAGSLLAVSVILSVVAIAYSGSAVGRRADVQRLQAENQELAEVNRDLSRTISEVQARLDDFEERTARLALAAGMQGDVAGPVGATSEGSEVGSGGLYNRLPDGPETLKLQGSWIEQQLDLVDRKLSEKGEILASTPTMAPTVGVLTDGFGTRNDPITGRRAFHRGLDISARRGTPVYAPADGVVVFAGRNGGLGKTIRISHGFGFTTLYGHLHEMNVKLGDQVHRGDHIGAIGNTGRSTGSHLHYEVHEEGKAKDPLYFILDRF
ncbi:MAG: peptidoglycan DD-metalloendopeptidase family protein [Candidatus Sulfomarinibacteraceae bacterium]